MFKWIRNLFGRAKPQGLKASDVDRAIVADVMARSGVPHPDARVVDRIAVAARAVITTVDEQADRTLIEAGRMPLTPGERSTMDVELDRVRDALTDELIAAGSRLSGAAPIGFEIMRRLRAQDDRGAA
jgi:hypothetical protein